MKRLGSVFLTCLIVFALSLSVCAVEQTTYYVDEAGLSIDIPADLVVFSEDMADDDPALAALGIAKADMLQFMKDNNLFLEALEHNANYEIVLTASDSEIMDFSQLSEDEIFWLLADIQSNLADMGLTFQKFEYYEHSQTEFLKVYFSQSSGEITNYALEYFTIYGGKVIVITMNSYSGDIDSEKESLMKNTIDSICFDAEPVVETPAFLYEDEERGVTFTVPANWTAEPVPDEMMGVQEADEYGVTLTLPDTMEDILEEYQTEDRVLKARFRSNFSTAQEITYGWIDAWSMLSKAEKSKRSRAEFDNSVFRDVSVAELYGLAEDDVTLVSYGGKEYYRSTIPCSISFDGQDFSMECIQLLRVENGYEYLFQIIGNNNDAYYEDFEMLLNSVQYPEVAPAEKPATETAEDTQIEDTSISAVKEADSEDETNDDTSARTKDEEAALDRDKAAVLEALVKALGATALYSFLTIAVLYVIRKRKKS